MTKVSIGLPVYNGEQFIRESIDSVLNQTFQDFELIISDNASTDNTPTIVDPYVKRDSRLQYYRNDKNFGAAYNYNRLVKMAQGEYFKWISHDDVIAPTYLERCVEILDHHDDVVLCYPKTVIIDEEGKKISDHFDGLELTLCHCRSRFRKFLRKPAGCNPVFGLMRTKALLSSSRIGSYAYSDYILLAEMCLKGKFWEIPESLFFRRNHQEMSRRKNRKGKELAFWFDTRRTTSNAFPLLKLLFELIKTVKNADISCNDKLLCYLVGLVCSPTLFFRTVDWWFARLDQSRMY